MRAKLIFMLASTCIIGSMCLLVSAGPPKVVNEAKGTLKLSDGSTFEGKIYLTGKRPLTMYFGKDRKRKTFPFEQIAWFELNAVKAGSHKKYIFKESGKDEKIVSEDKVPRLDIEITVHLKSGKSVAGTVQPTTIYVEKNEEREKFKLLKLLHGETNEELKSLVYVKEVRFGKAGEKAAAYKITGEVTPGGSLVAAAAWHRETMTMYEGTAAAGKYEIELPQAGAYDIMLTFSSEIRFWLGTAEDGSDGPDPEPEVAQDISAFVEGAKDFFDSKTVLKAVGDNTWAVVVVDKFRIRETHYNKKENPDARFRRVDVWQLEHTNVRWRVLKRVNLWREKVETKEAKFRRFVMDRALGGVVLTKEKPAAKRDLKVTESMLESPGRLPEAPPGSPTDPEPGKKKEGKRGRGKEGMRE